LSDLYRIFGSTCLIPLLGCVRFGLMDLPVPYSAQIALLSKKFFLSSDERRQKKSLEISLSFFF